jgi:hypothetical protein
MIDPRTMTEAEREGDCHLIPACLEVSNATVRLDSTFDHKIGSICDEQLRKYLETMFGNRVRGRASFEGGSKSLSAVLLVETGTVVVPKPKQGSVDQWADRAIGMTDGKVRFESFASGVVDCAAAFLSVVHSAFLVLHWHKTAELYGPQFNPIREWFSKAIERGLTPSDFDRIRDMVSFRLAFPRNRVKGNTVDVNDYRTIYDKNCDFGDGLLDDFPGKCVVHDGSDYVVTLPYSMSLRAKVTFAPPAD